MEPLLGEIRLFSWPWAPKGWAVCDGSLMSVRQYQALFSLLGDRYGGDGKQTFALPDLRGRAIVGVGGQPKKANYKLGQSAGVEGVALSIKAMPAHAHATNVAEAAGTFPIPKGALFAKVGKLGTNPTIDIYAEDTGPLVELSAKTVSIAGAGVPHENMQPFAVVGYCICTIGDYPPHSG